jgi:hypothetical protein
MGIYYDADSSINTEDNPFTALDNFNKITNAGTGVNTTCANDYWVFDATNCTYNAT